MSVRGERVNGKWRVQRADPHDRSKMPAYGVLIRKSTPTVGVMQVFGPCEAYSGLTPGATYLVAEVGSGNQIVEDVPMVGGSGYTWSQHIGIAVASDLLLLHGNLSMIEYIG